VLSVIFRKASAPSTLPDIVIVNGKITIEDVKEKVTKIEIRNVSGVVTARDRIYRLLWRERSQQDAIRERIDK
jgi:hypothetical protein